VREREGEKERETEREEKSGFGLYEGAMYMCV